jgi:hypothetical protein
MGLVATAILDLWVQLLKYAAGVTPINWAMVGRWFAHLLRGQFQHAAISRSPAVGNERLLGWVVHYLVGTSYALMLLMICNALSMPVTLLAAIGFGLVTVLAPWLILQPGMGLGRFARNAPNPGTTRLLNVVAHMIFGLGLYLSVSLIT